MAGRKIEILEREIRQLKFKSLDFQTQISVVHKKIDGKFAIINEMMQKLLQGQTKPTILEAGVSLTEQGNWGNPNVGTTRENWEVKILGEEEEMPPLESLPRSGKGEGMLVNSLPFHSTCQTALWCSFPSTIVSSSTNLILAQWNPSYRITSQIKLPSKERFLCSELSVRTYKLLATNEAQTTIQEDKDSNLWEESKQLLYAFNFTPEEADRILKKAFGWIHSPYWGEERRKETPNLDSIKEMLDYLKSLSLSDDDLHKILEKFPEVLGCCLNEELKANVQTLEREWGIKGKTLRNPLLRNPKVLGYNVDCKGDCMAKCTRCWVRF
ncbi:hypothetical protein M5K25_000700 [Dendrobium thyrsiflorum]|uniref:Mitochondrial transcription termination factor family protein n=1 Tax=Dendrobium thyrsiflorum TaxID=117978 RepID=A0ABD0VWA3_DENTH